VEVPGLNNVHPVFHASLLEQYSQKGTVPQPDMPITDTLREHGDDVYEVEHIVDRRKTEADKWEYLVKWARYPEEENSWETGPNISASTLNNYWKKHNILPKRGNATVSTPKRRGRPPKKQQGQQ
jgi:hypothetical protein